MEDEEMTEQEAALLLTLVPGCKTQTIRQIYECYGSFAAYFSVGELDVASAVAAPSAFYCQHRRQLHGQVDVIRSNLEQQNIRLLSLACEEYPPLLREIHDPPVLLYVKGEVSTLALPQIAIVGSRRASRGGTSQAESFATALAGSGFTVTSGLALGVDGAAHRGALKTGKTIAVLGSGVDVVYPRQHRRIHDAILDGGGAVVSEFPPGSPPLRHNFPRRNRIISGLSMGVLIVEAAARSGSLITARLAMEQGREVFAIPGSIHNPQARGCHQLIREGAVLTETLEDIVSQLGGFLSLQAAQARQDENPPMPADSLDRQVLQALGYEPMEVDGLKQALNLDVSVLTVSLVNLEIQGFIENLGGVYQRIR